MAASGDALQQRRALSHCASRLVWLRPGVGVEPRPISGGAVFAGKISLLVAFLGVFVIDGNLFGTLLVPAIAGGRSGSAVLVAHITVSPIRSPLIEYLTRNACLFSIQTLFR